MSKQIFFQLVLQISCASFLQFWLGFGLVWFGGVGLCLFIYLFGSFPRGANSGEIS